MTFSLRALRVKIANDQGIQVQAEIKELYPEENFVDKVKVEVWYERPVVPGIIQE